VGVAGVGYLFGFLEVEDHGGSLYSGRPFFSQGREIVDQNEEKQIWNSLLNSNPVIITKNCFYIHYKYLMTRRYVKHIFKLPYALRAHHEKQQMSLIFV